MMSDEHTYETATDSGAEATAENGGILQRAWHGIVAAGNWVADTFRGHSGAGDLKNRRE